MGGLRVCVLFREQIGGPGGRVLGTDGGLMEAFREEPGGLGEGF